MSIKNVFSSTLIAGALLAAGSASATQIVTLNPQADNGLGVNGIISAANPAFNTVGFSSDLDSTLVINTNVGVSGYSETGQIRITNFKDQFNNIIVSGVGPSSTYQINGNFTLTGLGAWTGTQFTAAPGTSTFSMNLFAVSATSQVINLGTATLNNLAPSLAFAIAFGSVAPGSSGGALTSLTANLLFAPAPGTTGATGFFQAPTPFAIQLAVGNAGGNPLNTGYSVNGAGQVTITTPIPGSNSGTANITFAAPEPGALALVGLALAGLGLASRRKSPAKAV